MPSRVCSTCVSPGLILLCLYLFASRASYCKKNKVLFMALKDAGFVTEYPGLSCDLHRLTSAWMVWCEPWLCHYKKSASFTKTGLHEGNTKFLFIVNTWKPTLQMKTHLANCSLNYTHVVFETFCSTLLIKDYTVQSSCVALLLSFPLFFLGCLLKTHSLCWEEWLNSAASSSPKCPGLC